MHATFTRKLEIWKGVTLDDWCIWKAGTPLQPVDLTGCSAVTHVRDAQDNLLLTMSTANGLMELNREPGEIRYKLSATETAALTWNSGTYDTLITFPDGTVLRKVKGSVPVARGSTRP